MGRFGVASGLAGGAVLVAFGAAVVLLHPLGMEVSRPVGIGLMAIGVVLVALQAWRLRRGPGGADLLWSSVLDAILLLATALAILPAVAVVRGFVELFAHTHVHDAREAVAYTFAFAGLLLGGVFFAYAVKYYLSTFLVLLTALLPSRHRNGHDRGNGRQHASGLNGISRSGNGNGNNS